MDLKVCVTSQEQKRIASSESFTKTSGIQGLTPVGNNTRYRHK
jgi:hypothetical protein